MNLLFLSKYGAKAASCRYRFQQYFPYLTRHGVRCTLSPLFDDAYLTHKFDTGRARAVHVAAAGLRRVRALLSARAYDRVVLAYEALPYLPALPERLLRLFGVPYVLDYDDAVFHNYDQSRLWRVLCGGKMRTVLAGAEQVLAGSAYLARYARAVNPRVEILPTVVDLDRYPAPRVDETGRRPLTIGWIGSPSTAAYLPRIAPVLSRFCAQTGAQVTLIGSGAVELPGVPLRVRPWSEDTEAAELAACDVGIMPLPDTPWARGKCGFKLIQYMATGLPVLASPIGANLDIVTPEHDGLLCQGTDEWLAALLRLHEDPALRARLGRNGRDTVATRFCLKVTAPRLLSLLLGAPYRCPVGGGSVAGMSLGT